MVPPAAPARPGAHRLPAVAAVLPAACAVLACAILLLPSAPLSELSRRLFRHSHPPLFPLSLSDRYGLVCATAGLILAAGGGIGGGGMLVPIYILVMGFAPKQAIPLSNVTVFGGACANCLLNFPKRHPLADRPLVDWDLILVMEPLTIAGALIGAFLNKVLPETVLGVALVVLLSFTAYNTLTKAVKMYKKETKEIRGREAPESELTAMAREEEMDDDDEEELGLLQHAQEKANEGEDDTPTAPPPPEPRLHGSLYQQHDLTPPLLEILEEERHTPAKNITTLLTLFAVVLVLNLLKGGGAHGSPLGIKCGSPGFWAANALLITWICVVAAFCRSYLVDRYHTKAALGYRYVEGDIQWCPRATLAYPAVCCLAGFFAGMFGIGGGIVKGPLMLAMGVHPKVAAASSACMILFTSFTATTSFYVFGLLVPDYAGAALCVGFTATYVGQVVMNKIMARFDRSSYIAFSVGAVVAISAFLMTVQSLVAVAEGTSRGTGGVC